MNSHIFADITDISGFNNNDLLDFEITDALITNNISRASNTDIDESIKIHNLCKRLRSNTIKNTDTQKESLYDKKNKYSKETTEYYKIFRQCHYCPLSHEIIDDDHAFKFYYQWDPLTGERTIEDPYGPLYFNPDYLIKYFYTFRLNKLYTDVAGGYQGYYDDGVGCGEDFHIKGRGYHPEWYLFRIPNMHCYIPDKLSSQIITFGPKLTDDEIKDIYTKACKKPDNYKHLFKRERPNLIEMKKLYDAAIIKKPLIILSEEPPDLMPILDQDDSESESESGSESDEETSPIIYQEAANSNLLELYAKENRRAVDALRKMKG